MSVVVYPKDSKTVVSGDDVYVPGLQTAFMLADNYLNPKTKQVNSPPIKDLKKYEINAPPIGWYMSEKFDGQRALWDGTKFVSRGSGSSLPRVYPYVPQWFIEIMPTGVALDGEFFIERNSFQQLGFLRSKPKGGINRELIDKKWGTIKYQVFDVPSMDDTFENRMKYLQEIIKERSTLWKSKKLPSGIHKGEFPIIYTKQYFIKKEEDVEKYYSELVSKEAEGVMIRAPKVPYIPKRSKFLLKLKPEHDAECMIVGYLMGTKGSKYENQLGSFHCEMLDSKGERRSILFHISGMDDTIRKNYLNTHPLGTIISYKYSFLTDDGKPRHPRYYRIK